MKALFPILMLMVILPRATFANPAGDTGLPEQWPYNKTTLTLNGAGFREYGFFRIKVYAAGLYLFQKDSNAESILNSSQPRIIQVKSLRNVSKDDSVKAWRHYLQVNCQAPCTLDPTALASFSALIPESIAGDHQTYIFTANTLEILRNGQSLGSIEQASFARTVLATWIGHHPSTEALKRALLGKLQP